MMRRRLLVGNNKERTMFRLNDEFLTYLASHRYRVL